MAPDLPMRLGAIEKKLIETLIIMLLNARGNVMSVRATSLVKAAGFSGNHSAVLKAARLLKKLSRYRVLKAVVENRRNRTYRYVIDFSDEIWQMARADPERAREVLLRLVSS